MSESRIGRLAPLLADVGHDVVHVSERDLVGTWTTRFWQPLVRTTASSSQLTPISASSGQRRGTALPSLVLFRQGNRGPEHRATTLLGNLAKVAEDLDAGAIVVFTTDNIRIRRLPVGD